MSRVVFDAKLLGETVSQVFDFTSRLAATETISSAAVAASVYSGTDSNPSAIVSGVATVSGQTVVQKVTAGLLGVTYQLKCTANTSTGQVLQLAGYLVVVPDLE